MPILSVFLALAVIYPLLLLWGVRNRVESETGTYQPDRLSDSVVVFAPFITLFYHDHFWQAFLYYLIPFNCYCALMMYSVYRWKRVSSSREMIIVNSTAGVPLTLIAYYLFFHQGTLANEPATIHVEEQVNHTWWAWWPFAVILFSGGLTAILNSEKMLWVSGVIFLLLPFFSHHPLWAMAVASLVFLLVCLSLAERQRNGAYVALFMFYMIGQIAALIAYAVFF